MSAKVVSTSSHSSHAVDCEQSVLFPGSVPMKPLVPPPPYPSKSPKAKKYTHPGLTIIVYFRFPRASFVSPKQNS
jgi:hypothetical protein